MKKLFIIGFVALFVLAFGACTVDSSPNARTNSRNTEQNASGQILDRYTRSQPVPEFDWSQLRQNLIEIETAQAKTTLTTSFFFNLGIRDPIQSCPSIGFPIASTSEITNPQQLVGHTGDGAALATLPQIDPNGIYAGHSTGTYVVCLDAQGRPYGHYWEGFVDTVTGPARWTSNGVELTGPSSFNFSAHK